MSNLSNLFTRARTYAKAIALVCAYKQVGQVGQVGRSQQRRGVQASNLMCPTSGRLDFDRRGLGGQRVLPELCLMRVNDARFIRRVWRVEPGADGVREGSVIAPEPAIMSRSEYARARNISTTHVSRLVKKERIVLDERGRVIVAASDALREKLRDPTRGGVGGSPATAAACAATSAGAGQSTMGGLESLSLAEASRAEKIERTRSLRLDNAVKAGELVRRAVVDAEVFRRARQAQELLMALRERLVPLLANESEESTIDAMLDSEFRQVLALLAARVDVQKRESA